MQYRKPEIVDCKRALEVVQGVNKGQPLPPDGSNIHRTPAAYEADE